MSDTKSIKPPNGRTPAAALAPSSRSRITNGKALFLGEFDGNSPEYRRYKDVFFALMQHLGGEGQASDPERYTAEMAAQLIVWAEREGAKLSRGEDLDIPTFTTALNTLRRYLGDLGLERRARDVTPSLQDYIAQTYGNGAGAE